MNRVAFITQPGKAKARIISAERKKIKRKRDKFTVAVGKSWVGRWYDGTLGWGVGPTISNWGASMLAKNECPWFYQKETFRENTKAEKEKVFLCRVTIEQLFDKNGRPIIRYKK